MTTSQIVVSGGNNSPLYDYSSIAGLEGLKGITTPPAELFAPWGGIEGYGRQLRADQANQKIIEAAVNVQRAKLGGKIVAMAIGDSLPVVFARRRTGGTGGVLVLPKATECQFSNSSSAPVSIGRGIAVITNSLTARYHCVLGVGQMADVEVRDVRNGLSRLGSFSQNDGQRAGSWAPGDNTTFFFAQGLTLPDIPQNCGIGGDYKDVTTIEFSNTYPITSDSWNNAWSVFVRGGLIVTRIFDGVTGPSDNICDLVKWALIESGIRKASEFNTAAMLKAATFIEANQLYCNAEFSVRTNIAEWITNILPSFLMREATVDEQYALVPLVPTNPDGTISTYRIYPDWIFTEAVIAPGSYSETPPDPATRQPLEIRATWRQQTSETEPYLDRDLLVGAPPEDLPAQEQMDLAGFVTSEGHAALAAGFRHATTTIGGATATVTLVRGGHTGYVQQGQIVHIFLQVVTEIEAPGTISGFWWVDQVSSAPDGTETLSLSSCPVDGQGRSLVALQTLATKAAAPGVLLPYPLIGSGDEPGRATDTSVPAKSTSGVPFSSGGSGASGGGDGFNRASPPASGPAVPPGSPGTGVGGSGNVAEAGGEPSKEEEKDKGGGMVPPPEFMEECPYGIESASVRIKGLTPNGGLASFSALDTIVRTTGYAVGSLVLGPTMLPSWTGGQIFEKWEVTYLEPSGTPQTLSVWSSTDQPFGPEGEFKLETVVLVCKTRATP